MKFHYLVFLVFALFLLGCTEPIGKAQYPPPIMPPPQYQPPPSPFPRFACSDIILYECTDELSCITSPNRVWCDTYCTLAQIGCRAGCASNSGCGYGQMFCMGNDLCTNTSQCKLDVLNNKYACDVTVSCTSCSPGICIDAGAGIAYCSGGGQ